MGVFAFIMLLIHIPDTLLMDLYNYENVFTRYCVLSSSDIGNPCLFFTA